MIIEKIIKNSPHLSWIKDGLILLVQHGSKAYNCHTEDSDDDYRGVCIPPKQYYYGVLNRFEQAELKDPDAVVYELQKFIRLATECNPNIMEILWVDESDRIFVSSIGEELISNRDLFLSKKIFYTMRGYAFNQIKRMKTHRNWLLNPVKEPLSRKEMGLPDQSLIPKDHLEALNAQIKKEIDKFNFDFLDNLTRAERIGIQEIMSEMLVSLKINSDDMYLATARKLGASDNLIEAMRKERDYENQKRAYKNYQEWIKNRNPKRAADEAKYGFDLKHSYHIVRLYTMCEEILSTGKVIVKRPDREMFMDIRNGKWSYDELMEFAENKNKKCEELYENSTVIPHSPNKKEIDKLCISLVEKGINLYK